MPSLAEADNAATIAVDSALSDTVPRKTYFCQLTQAVGAMRTLGNPANAKHRQPMAFILRQSAFGGNDYTLGTKYRTSEYVPVTPTLAAGAQDYIGVMYDGYQDVFDVVSFVPKYGGA